MFRRILHNVLELFFSYLALLSSSNKSSDFPRSKKESIEISKLVWTSPTRQSLFGKSLFDLTLLFAIAKSFFCCVWISLMTSLTCEQDKARKHKTDTFTEELLLLRCCIWMKKRHKHGSWIHLSEDFQARYHVFRGQRNGKNREIRETCATIDSADPPQHNSGQQTRPQTPVLRDQSGFEWTSISWAPNSGLLTPVITIKQVVIS